MCCVTYFTYAFYQWNSGNSDVNLTIKDGKDGSVTCTNGPSVDVKNIGPVLSPSDGVKTNFSINNDSSSEVTLNLGLNITSISNPLRVESFKYALYQDTTGNDTFDYSTNPILLGDFSKMSVGDNILSTTLTVEKESTYSFQFIVYIDGTMGNDSSMMNSSLSASITYGDCTNSYIYLSSVEPGSYVKYTGNNGCTGKACEGQNVGCVDAGCIYNGISSGWRVAYVKDSTAYIISVGTPGCMTMNLSNVSNNITNLNNTALIYCNSSYAYGGKCDSNSAWNMADADFQVITGDTLSIAYGKSDGYYANYPSIDAGDGCYYWFASSNNSMSSPKIFYWNPGSDGFVYSTEQNQSLGVRPILRLASSVIVTGGTGTSEDPYILGNGKLSGAEPGSYVKYTGNNGCTGKACEGQNANYVSDTDMGYCDIPGGKFNANGWRVAYVKDGTAYLTSAGSPECMCTDYNGIAGISCSSSEPTYGVPKHIANLNAKALTYCNSAYAYGEKCDSNSAWNMSGADFQTITGDTLSQHLEGSIGNDIYPLINNGGFYWFATPNTGSSGSAYGWYPGDRITRYYGAGASLGIRPILRLTSSVKITSGIGTYENPYIISNK